MSHVVSFSIEGLNGRSQPLEYTLNRDVNVFFGKNGSGKTSILKILHGAMSADVQHLQQVSFTKASVTIHTVSRSCDFTLTYEKGTTDTTNAGTESSSTTLADEATAVGPTIQTHPAPQWQVTTIFKPDTTIPIQRWRHVYLPTSRLFMPERGTISVWERMAYSRGAGSSVDSEELLDEAFAESLQQVWRLTFGEVQSALNSIQQKGLQRILAEVLASDETDRVPRAVSRPLDADKAFERMTNFLARQSPGKLSRRVGSKEEFVRRYGIDQRLRTIVNYIDVIEARIERQMRPTNQLEKLVQRLFSKEKSINFDGPSISVTTSGGGKIEIENLSSGEKHLIRILLSAISSQESSLLIDEPEMSMHIDWQRELISNIRTVNPECQLIFATHSPDIMAEISDEKVFRV